MPPKRLGNNFKTIKIECQNGHEVARYRKPQAEWGHRTHKLWLLAERLNRLDTVPPILDSEGEVTPPPTDTEIICGKKDCILEVGKIAIVQGTVALVLNEKNLKPTKG